ncbi:MAG: hypothetical protein PHZ00_01885 [Candidatus Peribacteraceae bacterium]|nr:hypothetical protein [Candidatus Peribacteraceae bacterium]
MQAHSEQPSNPEKKNETGSLLFAQVAKLIQGVIKRLQNVMGITEERERKRNDAEYRLAYQEETEGHMLINAATEGLPSIRGHGCESEADFRSILADGKLIHHKRNEFYGPIYQMGSWASCRDNGFGVFVPEPYKPIPFQHTRGEEEYEVNLDGIKWIMVRSSRLDAYRREAEAFPNGEMAKYIGKMRTYKQVADEIAARRDEFIKLQAAENAEIVGTYRG